MRFRVLTAVLWFLIASPAWAQFETGAVLGTVRDSSGGVLPGFETRKAPNVKVDVGSRQRVDFDLNVIGVACCGNDSV